MGMSYAKRDTMRDHPHFPRRTNLAFTLLELMFVVGVLALIAFLLLPALPRSDRRRAYYRINCVNNLKQVGLSFRLWGGDNGEKYPIHATVTNSSSFQQEALRDGTGAAFVYQVFQVMSNELGAPNITICPADKDRNMATNWGGHLDALGNTGISYFVGKDADESNPQQYLAGDRNIGVKPAAGWSGKDPDGGVTGFSPNSGKAGSYRSLAAYATNANLLWTEKLHDSRGNIVLSDGSVQQYSSSKMRAGITNAGDADWTYFP